MRYFHLTYEICELLSINFRIGILPILPKHFDKAWLPRQEFQSTFFFKLIARNAVLIIQTEELVSSVGTKNCSTCSNISTQTDHRSIDILIFQQQYHYKLWLRTRSWHLNRWLLGLFLFCIILLNFDQVFALRSLWLLLLLCGIHLTDIFVALFDWVNKCQSRILSEIEVSEYDLVEVVSQVICCFCVGVSDTFVNGKETKFAWIINFGCCCAALDDCDSVKVRLLHQTSMRIDSIAHDHSFFIRKNILQSLLETRNRLFWTEWNIFFYIWEIFCQTVSCPQERCHLRIAVVTVLLWCHLLLWFFAAIGGRLSWTYYFYWVARFRWFVGNFNVLGVYVYHFLWNFHWPLHWFLRFLLQLFMTHVIWFWIRLNPWYFQWLLLIDLLLLFCQASLSILPNQLHLRIKQLLDNNDLLLRRYLRYGLCSSCIVICAIQSVCLLLYIVHCLV